MIFREALQEDCGELVKNYQAPRWLVPSGRSGPCPWEHTAAVLKLVQMSYEFFVARRERERERKRIYFC